MKNNAVVGARRSHDVYKNFQISDVFEGIF